MSTLKLFLFVFYGILFLNFNSVNAQEKRYLTREDYKLWSEFGASDISADGKWVHFSLNYKETDSLFLQNIKTNKIYSFKNSHSASFSQNGKWFGFIKNDSLNLLNLLTSQKTVVSSAAKNYDYDLKSNFLIVKEQTEYTKSIKIIDLKTFEKKLINDVIEYQISPDKTKIAIVINQKPLNKVILIALNAINSEIVLKTNTESNFKGLKWDDSSKKLAFFEEIKGNNLSYTNHKIYSCTNLEASPIIQKLDPLVSANFPQNSYIPFSRLYVSSKTNKVFFDYKQIPSPDQLENKNKVQIWLAEDLTVPPIDKIEQTIHSTTWTSWDTVQKIIIPVEDEQHKNAVLTANDDYALLYSFTEMTPFYKYGGEFITIYIKNLKNGLKTILSSKQTRIENQVIVSPSGKYVNYFKNNNWWVYDINLQKHKCITIGMPFPLQRLDYDRPDLIPPYGSPGWTENDNNIIIYDQFDIWLMKPDGSERKKLTDGRSTGTIFRLYQNTLKQSPRDSFSGFETQIVDFKKNILLTTQNSRTSGNGYAICKRGICKQLVSKKSILNFIASDKNKKEYLFQESNFELPPRLITVNTDRTENEIKQSNKHQKNFFWGKSTLINYKIEENKSLKGALFYPANYDDSKKYPMLVVIYEKKSHEVLDYSTPSSYSDHGFNNTNYTTDGYFVLYPDIAYGINTTGNDALICVKAAVDEALKTASIDKTALALIGHSFGGFETAYIMGHTNIFKTAIIGAPMIDLVSAYLTLDGHGMSNMWRFEFDQFRMLTTYDSEVFDNNAPLKSAKNINAPLLIWTGTDDKQLDWKHSMKLQSALWRMGKLSTMLVYPNEEHVLTQKVNQLDLTTKCKEWLEFYLKNQPKKEWMGKQ